MDTDGDHLVFVYGTLKKGEPNYDVLQTPTNGKAEYIGKARTMKQWPLVIASRYNIPFLLYSENKGKHIIGEVFKVDDEMLAMLDIFESHPKYYERVVEEVEWTIDASSQPSPICKPWIYFLKKFRPTLLELPFLDEYFSKGAHGLEYVSRYNRIPGQGYHLDVMRITHILRNI